jgi:N,N'-diacetyllegionaminate synthase
MSETHVTIIAEAGVNHNGELSLAFELIDAAAKAGADFVKFQSFKADSLVTQHAKKAAYQIKRNENHETQYQMLKRLELSDDMHHSLIARCKEKNIGFLSSGFDLNSIDYLASLQIPIIKIPSGEITNLPYLRHVGGLDKNIILSTGMANMQEIRDAINILQQAGTDLSNITILHCNSEYPTPMSDVNLAAMKKIATQLNVKVGYSDHTEGIEVPIAAVALGAVVIEKHFTIDRKFEGPDHKASLEPDELSHMIRAIRNIQKAIGSDIKKPSKSELSNLQVVRKSIVASQNIKLGDVFSEQNITVKRPGNGISPMKWDCIIGTIADRNYVKDELIFS